MGCKASKAAKPALYETKSSSQSQSRKLETTGAKRQTSAAIRKAESGDKDCVYQILAEAHSKEQIDLSELDNITPELAAFQDPKTQSTPLHMAVRLLDVKLSANVSVIVKALLKAHAPAVRSVDEAGHVPLHYVVASFSPDFPARTRIVQMLWNADPEFIADYMRRNDIRYGNAACSSLYYALAQLPDEFSNEGNTVDFIDALVAAGGDAPLRPNASDGDKCLALLYRRFTRQFDLAEKFFSGDNSRPEVVEHRRKYKTAASNTWKIIEILLQGISIDRKSTIQRAVQVETPPDLLRYIVETNAEDLAAPDAQGRLPLHYAAATKSESAFYSKYVMDELLYKYPEAAAHPDAEGRFPLQIAVEAGKHWIGGGIQALYEAYPDAIKSINLEKHENLRRALSLDLPTGKEEKESDVVIRDEPHDAIMLVQQEDADISEVVTSLWAHEEDAGVQMLGCVSIAKRVEKEDVLSIALSAIPAVVNAMKAHPNEVIVQEKACLALVGMADTDGQREVSLVASGAVAAIVGAMQAHVSDPGVQEQACAALTRIVRAGGADRATIVASVSGLTAIVNAMAAHPHVQSVQQFGCEALSELTAHPSANLPELPKSQIEPLLEAARSKYPDECASHVKLLLTRLT